MGVAPASEVKHGYGGGGSGKRVFRPSLSSRHANEWPPTDVASDLTVDVGTASFALHKFPLVSRSGRIRRMIADAGRDAKVSRISLHATPGGAAAFELAAKFCYGIAVDITAANVAMLRCAAHHLQMTEDLGDKNLELRAESFLKDAVFPSISSSIAVLRSCERDNLLPAAEDVGLVTRLVASITTNACKEQLASEVLCKLELSTSARPPTAMELSSPAADWWGKSLASLGLDLFHRVLSSAKSKGLKQETVSRILIIYAHSALQGPAPDAEAVKKQRAVVEALVGLLPTQSRKSPVPMGFLSGLLKTATSVSASAPCRSDLEKRMAMQLEQAILEDILIPAATAQGAAQHHTLYDTETAARIFSMFVNLDDDSDDGEVLYDSPRSPKPSLLLKAAKLMDSYLAEIALDANLMPSKFIALAELLPDHARVVTDGLYRAVDIFLKVHPNIKDSERYRLCKTIDCQRLSQDACSHAAQNERLPVQMAVQVLYFEQLRLRNAIHSSNDVSSFFGNTGGGGSSGCQHCPQRSLSGVGSGAISPRDNYVSVRRENRELKLEVARMRMRLTDLEKDHVSMKQELVRVSPANKLLRSLTHKLCRLPSLFKPWEPRQHTAKAAADARQLFRRQRRHSIS